MNRRGFLTELSRSAAVATACASNSWAAVAASSDGPPRCSLLPLPEDQTSFILAGRETTRWHFGRQYPRPFFFPFNGPSGVSLTRMGHPGAPNHDHHRSIWFAHDKVDGKSFWSDTAGPRIRQKEWLCYDDGEEQCTMAVRLGWLDGDPGRELMEQTLVAIARPLPKGEQTLELQSTFTAQNAPVRLGQTNFGFLAVRMAKSISEYFGGGRLTDSEGRQTEANIFGQRAPWMDYSGEVAKNVIEGVTYFDHPDNPGHPTHWHVREDGWMGASFSMKEERVITKEAPLRLRYLLHAHAGPVQKKRAEALLKEFAAAPFYEVVPSKAKHRQYELRGE